jgi:D-galactarolactone cycloisomerase
MKIKSIETSVVAIPYDSGGPPQMFGGKPWTHLEILLVKVETDSGVTGWGEAFGHVAIPATRAALDTIVAPLFIGRDPTDITGLIKEISQCLHALGRNGPCIYALSGIDIALWDIAGKLAGQPLYKLLGGSRRERLAGYASLFRFGDPQLVAKNVVDARKMGYRKFKLHEVTREAVLAARDVLGKEPFELMLDTNCPWTPSQAVQMARSMRDDGLTWLEEPVWPPEDHDGLARVRAVGIPIAAGENAQGFFEFFNLFKAGAIDVAQPSVTKVGGVTEMRRIIALADAYGVSVVPHSPYLGPGFLATLHIIASMPSAPPVEALWLNIEASPFEPWIRVQEGQFALPQEPGLGCDPAAEVVERYRVGDPTLVR